nr:putative cuticle collagen 155 [Anser cygnoides]
MLTSQHPTAAHLGSGQTVMPALRDEALRVGTQPCAALTKPGTEAAAAGTQVLRFPSDAPAPRVICSDSTSRVCGLGSGFFCFLKAAGWHTGRHGRETRAWLFPEAAAAVPDRGGPAHTGQQGSDAGCGPHCGPTPSAPQRGKGGSAGALPALPAPPPPRARPGTHGCPADPRRRAPGMRRAPPRCDARRRGRCPEGSPGQHREQGAPGQRRGPARTDSTAAGRGEAQSPARVPAPRDAGSKREHLGLWGMVTNVEAPDLNGAKPGL